jgi:hypothetical protein
LRNPLDILEYLQAALVVVYIGVEDGGGQALRRGNFKVTIYKLW